MKKKILLTSMVTIVLCLCLIAGSTFALFTSEVTNGIAVTSGKVEIVANASLKTVYSAAIATDGQPTLPGKDGNAFVYAGNSYTHVDQQGNTFANKGTAVYENGILTIDRITPGDKVEFNVGVINNSNVAIKYRYKLVVVNNPARVFDGKTYYLTEALNVSLGTTEVEWDNNGAYATEWVDVESKKPISDATLSVELPVWVGNEYQNIENVQFQIIVEAVQSNGVSN